MCCFVFLTNGIRTIEYPQAKGWTEFDIHLTLHLTIKLKWITTLKVRHKIIKSLGDNIREHLQYLRLGEELLDMTPKTQSRKEKTEILNFIKNRNFCSTESSVKRMKWQTTDGEKISAHHISGKGFTPRIYKEFSKRNFKNKQQKIQIENGWKIWGDMAPKRKYE